MHANFQPAVYIMANRQNGTLYTGVTSYLVNRVRQHRDEDFKGHSQQHGTKMLVWYELHDTMETAILGEKRVKKWKRQLRINLTEAANPDWNDLALDFGFGRLRFMPVLISSIGDGPPPARG